METIYTAEKNYEFEKVEIFLRVKGRLPKHGDCLSQKILDDFSTSYQNGKLKQGMVPLNYLYEIICNGTIKPQEKPKKKTYFDERSIICGKCGYNKFKTVSKNNSYKCRKCGEIC